MTTTAQRYLTDAQIAGYHRDGYLAVPRLIDADRVAAPAQLRQAAISRDRVQPRPQRDAVLTVPKGAVCRDQGQLQGILGGLAATEHVRAKGQDARRVAVVDLLERRGLAAAHAGDQLVVGLPQD